MTVRLNWDENDTRWRRRATTIPAVTIGGAVYLLALPLTSVVAALVDLVRGRPRVPTVRLLWMGASYVSWEYVAVVMAAANWVRAGGQRGLRKEAWVERHRMLQSRWSEAQMRALRSICGLEIDVTGIDEIGSNGPVIIFCRHASIVDTMIPLEVLQNHGRPYRLRYVMKNELLIDPSIDLIGHRIPNHFVDRTGEKRSQELSTIRELAATMNDREGLVIFPEGSRFSEDKRAHRLAALQESDPVAYEAAAALRYTLPARPGGPLATLDGAPDADVIFIAHTGLEGLSGPKDIWQRLPFRAPLRVGMWRVERELIPDGPDERLKWLDQEWARVDEWIAENRAS